MALKPGQKLFKDLDLNQKNLIIMIRCHSDSTNERYKIPDQNNLNIEVNFLADNECVLQVHEHVSHYLSTLMHNVHGYRYQNNNIIPNYKFSYSDSEDGVYIVEQNNNRNSDESGYDKPFYNLIKKFQPYYLQENDNLILSEEEKSREASFWMSSLKGVIEYFISNFNSLETLTVNCVFCRGSNPPKLQQPNSLPVHCLLYTSDAADE